MMPKGVEHNTLGDELVASSTLSSVMPRDTVQPKASALGQAAIDLDWIAPSVASLTALAKSPLSSVWPLLRTDPGMVLLLARMLGSPDIGTRAAHLDHD